MTTPEDDRQPERRRWTRPRTPLAVHDPGMAAPPEEALDAAEDEEAPRPSNPFGHLRVPMIVVATLVLGVVLALQLHDSGSSGAPTPAAAAVSVTPDAQTPDASLARIASLLDQHRDAEARAEWLAFRRDHRAAPVPQQLRARIDALP